MHSWDWMLEHFGRFIGDFMSPTVSVHILTRVESPCQDHDELWYRSTALKALPKSLIMHMNQHMIN